jgi:hypothetical protein
MIRNLKDTTLKNAEQDWLKTNLAKFSRMLQGQKDLLTVGRLILSELAPRPQRSKGVFYMMDSTTKPEEPVLRLLASYAYKETTRTSTTSSSSAKASSGSARWRRRRSCLSDVPNDYIKITSGLGEAKPSEHHRHAGRVRGPGESRHGAGQL